MMASIDSTIVILALFPIAVSLDSDFVTMVWVVIAYLLANTALVLSLGRIADIYGRKKMYNIGFVVFTIGSVVLRTRAQRLPPSSRSGLSRGRRGVC